MKYSCAVCNREREATQVDVFKVESSEAASLSRMNPGGEVPKEVAVCKVCARLMQNKATALQVIRGTLVSGFRAAGVPLSRAEAAADLFCKKLSDRSNTTPVS